MNETNSNRRPPADAIMASIADASFDSTVSYTLAKLLFLEFIPGGQEAILTTVKAFSDDIQGFAQSIDEDFDGEGSVGDPAHARGAAFVAMASMLAFDMTAQALVKAGEEIRRLEALLGAQKAPVPQGFKLHAVPDLPLAE